MVCDRCGPTVLGPATAAALVLAAVAGCSLSPVAPAAVAVPAAAQPNVLLLFADDLRRDGVAALGSAGVRTPHLDRLVHEGLSFDKAYVAGSIHGAVCMPSRAMLMTGRHFNELPLTITSTWSVPAEERGLCEYPTLFEVFDSAGYETFMTGKWHNGAPMLRRGLDGGGSIFLGGMSDHDKVPVHDFDPTGKYGSEGTRVGKSFSSQLFADEAIDFLGSREPGDDPFFTYVAFTAPHDPRMAPEEWETQYPPSESDVPPNFMPGHPYPIGDMHVRDEELAAFPRTRGEIAQHVASYHAMIAHLDDQVGRILEALEESGQAENTIIAFVGDNGLAVGQHGLVGKQNLYEHSSGVPFVLSGPGIAHGTSGALTYVHDLFPTLCELAEIEVPASVTARSLAPEIAEAGGAKLLGKAAPKRELLMTSYGVGSKDPQKDGQMRAVTDGRYKLIRSKFQEHDVTRLFDLETDPWELADLSEKPEFGDLRRELESALSSSW